MKKTETITTVGYNRMNILLPGDLKEEVDAVTADVNWSAIAAEAFRTKLLELRGTDADVKSMDDAVKRLRAAQDLEGKAIYKKGLEAGRLWAMSDATPGELRRLAKAHDENQSNTFNLLGELSSPWEIAGVMDSDIDRLDEAKSFLGVDEYDDLMNEDFIAGFVDAALEVWDKV